MPRAVRDTTILAKVGTTYGTDSVPAGANAILCAKPKVTPLVTRNVPRELVRAYFGASEELIGVRYSTMEIECELVGGGTAGAAPPIGPLLRACGLAQTIAASRVDYTPITNNQEWVDIYYFDSGVRHVMLGARGNVKFGLGAGEKPTATFMFTGITAAISAATPSGVDYSAFKTPLAVTDANTGDVTLGGTVSDTGAPAITGGTAYPSLGLNIDIGNQVEFIPLLGGESVDITGRTVVGDAKLDLTAAQEVTFHADVLAATLRAVSLIHGLTTGYKVLAHLPSTQLHDYTKEELSGRRLIGFKLRGVPTPGGSGNDEFRLVFF